MGCLPIKLATSTKVQQALLGGGERVKKPAGAALLRAVDSDPYPRQPDSRYQQALAVCILSAA